MKKITCKVIPQQMLPRNVRIISCMFAEGDIILPNMKSLGEMPFSVPKLQKNWPVVADDREKYAAQSTVMSPKFLG